MLSKPRACVPALLVLFAFSAAAQTTIHVPADQPTIQAGINAAKNGDTVLVAPGTYYENIDFLGKVITVTSSDGPSKTAIDGSAKAPAVTFKSGEPGTTVLSGFTVQHGGTHNYNLSGTGNGGIYLSLSSPTIKNNVITQNNCWGIDSQSSAPSIAGNEISATQDPGSCSFGGGAGILVWGNYGNSGYGSTGRAGYIVSNTIENNVQSGLEDAGGNGGAGIAIWGASPFIENNIIRNNYTPGGSGGAINIESGINVVIAQNLIYGNKAGCGGGAIATQGSGVGPGFAVLVANNTIVNNINQGSAGYSECAKISQIYPSPDSYGTAGPTQVFVNNIVVGSTADPAVNCSWFGPASEATQPIFDHNLLYNAGGAFFGNFCIDTSAKYGNVSADPQFADPANGDFHLKAGSPAIDMGNSSVLTSIHDLTSFDLPQDFDNNTRVQDATGKGWPIIDMGAYEYSGVAKVPATDIVLTSSAYTGNAGPNYTLTATLPVNSLGVPMGNVTFFMDGQPIGTSIITSNSGSAGTAVLTGFVMTPGVHSFYATYPGQGSFTPAVSVIIIVQITKYSTALTLTSSPNPSLVGQSVTFTVKATSTDPSYVPSPVTVTDYLNNNAVIATLTPDATGSATFSTNSLTVGYHSILATYAGDSGHEGSSATVLQQVTAGYTTGTSVSSSLNPSPLGQSVTFTAHVTSGNGTPTGSVQFSDGSTSLGMQALDNTGAASIQSSSLSAGKHTITATYVPTGSFAGSSGSMTQNVSGAPTMTTVTATPTTAPYGSSISVSVTVTPKTTVTGTPSGNLTLYSNGAKVATCTLAAGQCSFSVSFLPVGTDQLTAVYDGDTLFAGSTSAPFTVTITAAVTTLTMTSHANPAPALLTGYSFVALLSNGGTAITGQPVVFNLQGHAPVTVNTDSLGQAVFTTPYTLHVGSYTVSASYAGSTQYSGASSTPFTETIFADRTSVTLTGGPTTVPLGAPVSLTATIADIDSGNYFVSGASTANGTVNFYDGATLLTSINPQALSSINAAAQLTISTLSLGTHTITAAFVPGTPDIAASTSGPITINVINSDFSLSISENTLTVQTEHHRSLDVTVTSTGAFAGQVGLACGALPPYATCQFTDPAMQVGANGQATTHLTVDTDIILGFKSSVDREQGRPGRSSASRILLAALLPLGLFAIARRRNLRSLLATAVVALALSGLAGCGDKYPAHTPPGTYTVPITATGNILGVATTHQVNLTLVVTP